MGDRSEHGPLLASDPVEQADAFIASGAATRAVELLAPLIAEGRGGILSRLALARAFTAAGRVEEALACLRETSALAPGLAEVACALGEALLAAGHMPTAIAELQRALRLDPGFAKARFRLGCAWLEAGEPERALAFFSELAGDEDFAQEIAAKRDEAETQRKAPRAPAAYVRHLFDQFSADYDSRMLGTLDYQAPAILRSLADLVLGVRSAPLRILDLGCGTGLSGVAFADLAKGGGLDGIDLSPRMVEAARARGCYDVLEADDIERWLGKAGPSYDLILAADTLVYLGDLRPVFAAAARRLAPDGIFLFTVERAVGEGFELGPKRRYRHAETYLRGEAAGAGFELAGMVDCVPRTEAGQPVDGLAVALRRL
jgi:predicted TPR repeat methyltransferase